MESRVLSPEASWVQTEDLRMRDPFVLTEREQGRYYLYGTTDPDPWNGPGVGFDAYTGDDLKRWHGPHPVFRPPEGFWATRNFWAPEVYRVASGFVMFASFNSEAHVRSIQALRSDSPLGPFELEGPPLTPLDWDCLDGTLFTENGDPWLVFCREWLQVNDGQVCGMRLDHSLASSGAVPEVLFRASEAPWVKPVQETYHFVTDGPFVHRRADGALLLLWSSMARGGYAVGVSKSQSGRLEGPWEHQRRPLYDRRSGDSEGGHAMIFEDLDGQLVMTLHGPNRTPDERPLFLEVEESGPTLRIKQGGSPSGIGSRSWRRWRPWRR